MDLPFIVAQEVLENLLSEEALILRLLNRHWNALVAFRIFREVPVLSGEDKNFWLPIIRKYGKLCRSLGFVGALAFEENAKSHLSDIISYTPNLNSLKLCAKGGELTQLKEAKDLKYLGHLSLCLNFHIDRTKFLQLIPSNLSSLQLCATTQKFLDVIDCPKLKVLTLTCAVDRVIVPDNTKDLFPSLSELRIHGELRGQGFTLLRVNFDTRQLLAIGALKKKTGTMFSFQFNKGSDERLFPTSEKLSKIYVHLVKLVSFPCFYSHVKTPFQYPSEIKISTDKKIETKVLFNMFRTETIFLQFKLSDRLKYHQIHFLTRYLTVKSLSRYRLDFICWIQKHFTMLKELYLQRTLAKITWVLEFRSLEVLHSPIEELTTIDNVIQVSPMLKVFHTALDEKKTEIARAKHPGIIFKKFNPNGCASSDKNTGFHFCKHGF